MARRRHIAQYPLYNGCRAEVGVSHNYPGSEVKKYELTMIQISQRFSSLIDNVLSFIYSGWLTRTRPCWPIRLYPHSPGMK